MKFGIIGPGHISARFADVVRSMDGVEVIAVASATSPEKAQAFAAAHGIPLACGIDALLANPEVDAVYIGTINPLHAPVAKQCIEAGKPVLCEKPLTASLSESAALAAFAREKRVLLMEGMWTLHMPCVQKAKQWIDEGRIGKVKYCESSFLFYAPVTPAHRLFNATLGGGAALDVGIYSIALPLYLMPAQEASVTGAVYTGETGVDEIGAALIQFADGAVANCRFGMQGQGSDSAEIYGDKGSISLPLFWKCREATLRDPGGNAVEVFTDEETVDGFVHQIRAFRSAWEAGLTEVPVTDLDMTLRCAKVLEAVKKP